MKEFQSVLSYEHQKLLDLLLNDPRRSYHNYQHCVDVYNYCMELYNNCEQGRVLSYKGLDNFSNRFFQLASVWHDTVYDPKSNDNEDKSALVYLRNQDGVYVEPVLKEAVYKAITDTRNHPQSSTNSDLIKIFLDADLYELGSEWELFDHNSKKLFDEYMNFHPNSSTYELNKGRIKWIDSFLAHPQIYKVATWREQKARENLSRQRQQLQTKIKG